MKIKVGQIWATKRKFCLHKVVNFLEDTIEIQDVSTGFRYSTTSENMLENGILISNNNKLICILYGIE